MGKPTVPARQDWLDALKGIGIFFVVLGHTVGVPPAMKQLIFAFHIPLFFWASGVTFKPNSAEIPLTDFIRKRFRTRMVPYFCFALFSWVLWAAAFRHVGTRALKEISLFKPLLGIFYGSAWNDFLEPNIVLWFFPCLFITEILFLVLLKSGRSLSLLLAGLAVLGPVVTALLPFGLPLESDVALTAAVFFGLGFLCRDRVLSWRPAIPLLIIGLLGTGTLTALCALQNGPVAVLMGEYGNPLLFYPAALAGTGFWYLAAHLVKHIRAIPLAGRHTLAIFALHLLLFPFFTALFRYGFGLPPEFREASILWPLTYTILAICTCIPISRVLTARLPLVMGRPSHATRTAAQ